MKNILLLVVLALGCLSQTQRPSFAGRSTRAVREIRGHALIDGKDCRILGKQTGARTIEGIMRFGEEEVYAVIRKSQKIDFYAGQEAAEAACRAQ